jgi:Ras GTPase-activating-like protein IQGAP2/3
MSSHDGGRSVRQSKRYSMTTLYLSMSANEKDLEIEDDLAKGMDMLGFNCVYKDCMNC